MNILEMIQPIFREVLDDDDLVISRDMSASDIDDWDSFTQIHIIVGVEKMFSIKLSVDEIAAFRDIGDMVEAIERHLANSK